MAHAGQILEGPGGYRLRLVRVDAEFFERVYGGQAGEGFLEEFAAEIRFT
jgi:hypothetical protein